MLEKILDAIIMGLLGVVLVTVCYWWVILLVLACGVIL